jgi:hypothetical protein
MPQLANITVKKADGTTDIVWTGIVPSSGDKTPAVWKSQTVGTTPGVRPELRVRSESNQAGTARRVKTSISWPSSVLDVNGRPVVADRAVGDSTMTIPQNLTDTEINEFVHQYCNLLSSALMM